jgi:hypothetical protein
LVQKFDIDLVPYVKSFLEEIQITCCKKEHQGFSAGVAHNSHGKMGFAIGAPLFADGHTRLTDGN